MNKAKISYAVQVLFREFLGLEYTEEVGNFSNVEVAIGDNTLVLNSSYFSTELSMTDDELPTDVYTVTYIGYDTLDFISLYDGYIETNGQEKVNVDILGSTFFMLTRWEELVKPERDVHNRFPAHASCAYANGFLHRPIVNEYVELLWQMLQRVGITQKRKSRTYKLVPTHDVDIPFLFHGLVKGVRSIAGMLARGQAEMIGKYFKHLIHKNDPYDSYDLLMDLSEKKDTKSHFFFLQKGKAKQDENHEIDSKKVRNLIKKIGDRGHHIGFHPSYNSYDDVDLFSREKKKFEIIVGHNVTTGRHHFLRWHPNETPKIWDDCNMDWDSTLGYADHVGFRCGVCYPFPLYDLKNDRMLQVYERPLIAMEWSLVGYQQLEVEASASQIRKLKEEVMKYNGEFVFLYHNSAFFTDEYIGKSEFLLEAFYN